MRKILVVLAIVGLAACGGSSSNGDTSLLHMTVDSGATKYSSGAAIDLGAFSKSDGVGASHVYTFTLLNDSDQTVALDGIEFVSGTLSDGTNTISATNESDFYDFEITNDAPLSAATFAPGDSANFTVTFHNWSYYVAGRGDALWHARKKYRVKVADAKDQPADFVFEVYGVASC